MRFVTHTLFLILPLVLAPRVWAAPQKNGELMYDVGKRFETVVFEPRLLATLPAVGKSLFLVFSGLGCSECDMNRSIYIHSPSDAPMESGETGDHYSHPGKYYDYMSGELVENVRMFVGRCTPAKDSVVVWFSNARIDSGRWSKSTFVARVEGQTLVANFTKDRLISIPAALNAIPRGSCREVPGEKFSTEP